jgi:S1-C subfamily serine protease
MIDNKRHTNSYKSLVLGIALFLTACSSYDIEKEQETETVIQSENVQQKPNQELIVIESSSETLSRSIEADTEEKLLNNVFTSVAPSVVHISIAKQMDSTDNPRFPEGFGFGIPEEPDQFFQRGEGSGFVYDKQGHIVTNYHVVQDAEILEVSFMDGLIVRAKPIGGDPDSDIAVIKVDVDQSLLFPVNLGNSDESFVGQRAITIGNPFGQTWSLTAGVVSAVGRTLQSGNSPFSIPEMIQTDASINPGNSGGPLLDSEGKVLGVNTMILSQSRSSSGVGFAVPVNIVKMVVPHLIKTGQYVYPWLGVTLNNISLDVIQAMELDIKQRGALVIDVIEDSPADNAGIISSREFLDIASQNIPIGGDIVVGIEGAEVKTTDDLISYLVKYTQPQDSITLRILRENTIIPVDVNLEPRP